jgi:hypothetical protein
MNKKLSSPSSDQLKRIGEFAWKQQNLSSHLSSEEISTYIEAVLREGEATAGKAHPDTASHLAHCDGCLAEYLLVKQLLSDESIQPEVSFKPDLGFLRSGRSTWELLEQHTWKFVHEIKIKIEQARLILTENLNAVQFMPVAVHAVRGQSEGGQSGTVEMIIDLPDGKNRVRLLLVSTPDGPVQLLVRGMLGSESGQPALEDISAQLETVKTASIRHPVMKKGLGLDFGLLPPGAYRLSITYAEEKAMIPFLLNTP